MEDKDTVPEFETHEEDNKIKRKEELERLKQMIKEEVTVHNFMDDTAFRERFMEIEETMKKHPLPLDKNGRPVVLGFIGA